MMLAYLRAQKGRVVGHASAAAVGNVNVARQRRRLRCQQLGAHRAEVRILGAPAPGGGPSACNSAPLPWSFSLVLMLRTIARRCICLAV